MPASVHRTLAGKDNTWPTREDEKCKHKTPPEMVEFFLPKTCPRHVLYGRTILGLPRKIGNANTRLHQKWWSFLYRENHSLYEWFNEAYGDEQENPAT